MPETTRERLLRLHGAEAHATLAALDAETARQAGADDRRADLPRRPASSLAMRALTADVTAPADRLTLRIAYLDGWDDPTGTPALPPVHDHGPGMWAHSCPACRADVPHPEPYAEENFPADWTAPTA